MMAVSVVAEDDDDVRPARGIRGEGVGLHPERRDHADGHHALA
jgi:hypothetical protein